MLPMPMSEYELVALEARHKEVIADAKRIRDHLRHCEHGDAQTLAGFDELLKYVGIYDQVVPQPATQPKAEMACQE